MRNPSATEIVFHERRSRLSGRNEKFSSLRESQPRLGGCKSRGFAERGLAGQEEAREGWTSYGGGGCVVEGFVGRVAGGYRREGELRNAMSGLVQPAGDASIDLGSDLTPPPFLPSSARHLSTTFTPRSPLSSLL